MIPALRRRLARARPVGGRLGERVDGRLDERVEERGAIVAMTAVLMVLVLAAASFAVDLGMQRVARSDMQALADVVALDLSRQLDGRTAGQIGNLQTKAEASRDRNRQTLGTRPVLSVELGTLDAVTGAFVPVSSPTQVPNAVKVSARTSVDFAFHPGSGAAVRSAIGQADSNACFELGSYAAALTTSASPLLSSLLGQTLGSGVDLTAVGYRGLASAHITLLDLIRAPQINVGTPAELMDLGPVTFNNFVLAVANALTRSGDTADAAVLQTLLTHVGPVATGVDIGSLLALDQGGSAALSSRFNVFDLVSGAAFLANGTHSIAVQDLGLSLPLVGSVTGSLQVIERARQACGRTGAHAETAQVRAGPLAVNLATLPSLNLAPLTTVSLASPAAGSLSLHLAGGAADLTDIRCTPASKVTVSSHSELSSVDLRLKVTATAQLSVLGLGLVKLSLPYTIALTTAKGATTPTSHSITIPPQSFDTAYPTGSGTLGLEMASSTVTLDPSWTAQVAALNVRNSPLLAPVLATLLPQVLSGVTTSVVAPVAAGLNANLIKPLQTVLGVQVAGADLFATLPAPICNAAALRG